jgi:hypothetical protein
MPPSRKANVATWCQRPIVCVSGGGLRCVEPGEGWYDDPVMPAIPDSFR